MAKKMITTHDVRYAWMNSVLDAGISEELIGKGLGYSDFSVRESILKNGINRLLWRI